MKHLALLTFIILTLSACNCKHGFGPSDCDVPWSDNYAGSWSGTANCGSGDAQASGNIAAHGATRIIIENQIYGELSDWDAFDVPSQIIIEDGQPVTVYGRGGLISTSTQGGTGQIQGTTTELWFQLHREGGAGPSYCTFSFIR